MASATPFLFFTASGGAANPSREPPLCPDVNEATASVCELGQRPDHSGQGGRPALRASTPANCGVIGERALWARGSKPGRARLLGRFDGATGAEDIFAASSSGFEQNFVGGVWLEALGLSISFGRLHSLDFHPVDEAVGRG